MTTTRYTKSGRPPGHQPEKRPLPEIDSRPAIVTAAAPSQEAASGVMVHGEPDPERELAARNGKRRLPAAYGSVYAPCPGRGMFAVSYRVPGLRRNALRAEPRDGSQRPPPLAVRRHDLARHHTRPLRRCPVTVTTASSAPDPVSILGISDERDTRLRFALAMWADGYRAGSADLLRAFGDGWRCGLGAGAERGTAA